MLVDCIDAPEFNGLARDLSVGQSDGKQAMCWVVEHGGAGAGHVLGRHNLRNVCVEGLNTCVLFRAVLLERNTSLGGLWTQFFYAAQRNVQLLYFHWLIDWQRCKDQNPF